MSLRPGAVNFKEKWGGLRETIIDVVRLSPVNTVTWNDHYSDIYALCEAFPEPYADKLFAETEGLLAGFVTELHEALAGQSSLVLLRGYQKHWLRYQQGAKFLDNLFNYFNRVALRKYLPSLTNTWPNPVLSMVNKTATTPTKGAPIQIRHMVLRVWKQCFLEKRREQVVAALLHEVKRERDGEEVDISMVRDVVASFIEVEEAHGTLHYYQDCFESPFLEETGQYYRAEASGMVVQLSCSQYMRNVVARLQAARSSGTRYLHQTTITKFMRECESRLVVDYKEDYLYLHMQAMVRQENTEDLANLYLLLHSIPKAIQPVVTEFQAHVKEQGILALRQLYEDRSYSVSDFMTAVLDVHHKYHDMVCSMFASHKDFKLALDKACRLFVNNPDRPLQQPKAPLLLARYCDQLLRKSSKILRGGDVEDALQHAITVFCYVEDKDLFQRFYSRMLSRRLVQALSLSMEAEESMIHKLKHACGYEYTSRLQHMVVDVQLSADILTDFHKHLTTMGKSLPIRFSIMILQSAAWPLQPSNCTPTLPAPLRTAMTEFDAFYTSKHSGRTLTWLHHQSLAEVHITYLKKPYTICVTSYQMIVLCVYNDGDRYSLASLRQLTQLPLQDLISVLQSLLDNRLLLEEKGEGEERCGSASPSNSSTSKNYLLNMEYFNKRTRFKVTTSTQKEGQQEIESTVYSVTEDRKLFIQAAIVRVMKSRKSLQHNQLIQETISQVRSRFTPSIHMIKHCIEALMEKQYLQRHESSRETYQYMA